MNSHTLRFHLSRTTGWAFAASLLFVLLGWARAHGDSITSGYDLFATVPGASSIDMTALGLGGGLVTLQGVPFVAGTDIDTIVGRTGSLPPGGTGDFAIQLNELFLKSEDPHDYGGSIGLADLYITRNDDPTTFKIPLYDNLGPAPIGTGTIVIHNDNLGINGEGRFSSVVPVIFDVIFTKVCSNPFNASDVLAHTVIDATNDPLKTVQDGVWSHTPRFDDPHSIMPAPYSEAGHYYPGVDPATLGKVDVLHKGDKAALEHVLRVGQLPEPSTWVLCAMAGIIAPIYVRWRRRRA